MESSSTVTGFIKVCARWIPKQLTGEHKGNLWTACPGLLNCYHEEDDGFWGTLSLGMRHGYAITLQKANTTLWNWNIQLPVKRRFKSQPLVGKVILTLILAAQGPILEHCQESSTAVNSVHYSEIALGPVETNYVNQMLRVIINCDTMLHYTSNAHSHTAAHTTESLHHLNFILNSPHIVLMTLLLTVWSTLRHFESLPFCQWPWSERSCVCVACHPTQNILSCGHTED
jgi:hypothetical protein